MRVMFTLESGVQVFDEVPCNITTLCHMCDRPNYKP